MDSRHRFIDIDNAVGWKELVMKKLYIKSTGDELDLIEAVAETREELADMLGTTKGCVSSSISHKHKGWSKIVVDED